MKKIGFQLRSARKLAGHSVETMSLLMGLSRQTINNYESGRVLPGSAGLLEWAHHCGCTGECLLASVAIWKRLVRAESTLRAMRSLLATRDMKGSGNA